MKLTADKLSLSYGLDVIFKNLSFSVEDGDILGICGANGSGKSSLCLLLAGLMEESDDTVFSGAIELNGRNISDLPLAERAAVIGIVFQNPEMQIFSSMVEEELSFAPENLMFSREKIILNIEEALKLTAIEHLKVRGTENLSSGEKQLVAIASTLTARPRILIADEVTSRTDAANSARILKVLQDFAREDGIVIMVTHNPGDLDICNKTLTLTRGQNYADRN